MNSENPAPHHLLPIIHLEEFLAIYSNPNVVVIDASNAENAKEKYAESHLEKALFVDLNTQLSNIKEDLSNGGRHPLPPISDFLDLVSSLGISEESHVVVYDDHFGGNAAARFWWMLRAIGHQKVQVLNGGVQKVIDSGLPISNRINMPTPTKKYTLSNWQLPIVKMEDVERDSVNEDYHLIDVRQSQRYRGEFEPIDLVAGHIPGAINIPFSENLNADGTFKSPDELKQQFKDTLGTINPENVSVYCGSGVTACHTILAMQYAGLGTPKLYTGSWSEWSRNNMPMATEK